MNAAKAVTANFVQRCVTLTTAANGDGVINVAGNAGACAANSYPWGSTVNLTAVPNAGSDFTAWQGDGLGNANPLALLMNDNKAVQAQFAVQAANDNINQATVIPLNGEVAGGQRRADAAETYSITLSTVDATHDPSDPTLCVGGLGNATVWFKVIAPTSGYLDLSTEGSAYSTVLSVWHGTPGALIADACTGEHSYNTDNREVFAQQRVRVIAGQTYYIQVADCALPEVFEDPDNPIAPEAFGGLLRLTAKFTTKTVLYFPLMR